MLILSLLACQPADRFFIVDNFTDGIELSDDAVADSYAYGSDLHFTAMEASHWGREADLSGFTLVSSDPAVVAISSSVPAEDSIEAEAEAVGPGSADLLVLDETGATVHAVAVEVAVPDAVTLAPKLGIDAGSGFVASEPQKILVGSYSAFEAQFTAVGRGLAAHGVLGAVGGDSLTVEVEDSTLWEDREWLSVWPTLPGEQTVDVLAAGATLDEVVFEAVDVAEVVGLEVIGNVSGVGAEGTVIVGVVGVDGVGDMVLGVNPTWVLPDGTEWVGDELSYEPDDSIDPVTLTVRLGSVETTATIAGRPTGTQSSSSIGCSSTPAGPAPWLAVIGALVLAARRRPI